MTLLQKDNIVLQQPTKQTNLWLTKFATLYIIVTTTCYGPIETFGGGFGPLKLLMIFLATVMLFTIAFVGSKATVMGFLYIGWQFAAAGLHPESWRWSTLLFSAGFVFSYICLYNLIYVRKVFQVDYFIRLVKGLMLAFFIMCLIQQCCILAGIRYMPLLNLWGVNRGIGCCSLSMEPSTFARTMLVCYYCYIKCNEYKRNRGLFSLKELFSGEHKWVSIRFLWMMTTMGSGTAYGCLIALSCYFISKKNCGVLVPLLLAAYVGLQFLPQPEQMKRATSLINAIVLTRDVAQMQEAEGSGASRFSPVINSFNADFSKFETWFGHGIDYVNKHNLVVTQKCTLFDDYGFVFYLISLLLCFSCGYRFFSLGAVFMFMGVGGGAGNNIHYVWALMVVMTCERYFFETQKEYQQPAPVRKIATVSIG